MYPYIFLACLRFFPPFWGQKLYQSYNFGKAISLNPAAEHIWSYLRIAWSCAGKDLYVDFADVNKSPQNL
jgi:hypothetical protein